MTPPTMPASQEIFGHWAIILLLLLLAALAMALFRHPAAAAAAHLRKPSTFEIRYLPVDAAAFDAAHPSILRQKMPEIKFQQPEATP